MRCINADSRFPDPSLEGRTYTAAPEVINSDRPSTEESASTTRLLPRASSSDGSALAPAPPAPIIARRSSSGRYAMNLSLTLIVTSTLLFYPRVPGVIVFMVGLATSLLINYPSSAKQLTMVKRQSSEALLLAAILFCASVFLGIVTKSGMIDHPADAMISIMSMEIGRYLYLLLGVIATPLVTKDLSLRNLREEFSVLRPRWERC